MRNCSIVLVKKQGFTDGQNPQSQASTTPWRMSNIKKNRHGDWRHPTQDTGSGVDMEGCSHTRNSIEI